MGVFWEGKYRVKNGYPYQQVKNEFYEPRTITAIYLPPVTF